MATTLTLTPSLSSAVAQALNDRNPFYLAADGLDLPVVSYDEEYAESIYMEGGRRVRSREQNPEGKVTLMLTGGLTGSQVRTYLDQLEQTVQACRVYGGTLALALEGTTTVTYDLESISLTALDVGEFQFERAVAEISVTTRPYGRLAPVSLVTNATSSDPIQSVSLADIPGSAPALVSATVTDTATQARDHLEIGLDADWDGSAALLIDSASLSTTGLAGSATTRTGAYTSTGVIRTALGPDAIALCEATGLSHKGRHRAKLRVYGTGTGPIYVRVAYRVASGAWSRNSWVRVPALDAFYEIDCGVVTANGNGTLSVRVEAYSALTTFVDALDIDYLLMIPTYRWAKAKGTADTITTTYGARDQFSQSAAPLVGAYTTNGVSAATNASPIVVTSNSHGLSNGDEVWIEGVSGNTAANGIWTVANKTTNTFELSGSTGNGAYTFGGTISKPGLTADAGGKWHGAGIIGAAAADSFQVEATGHTAQRTKVSDSSLDSGGSYAILGSTVAACKVQVTVKFSIPLFFVAHYRFGLLARYVDADNWAALVLCDEYPAGLHLYKKASGTVSRVAGSRPFSYVTINLAHALRLEIDANGAYRGYWFDNLLLSGADSVFATGGVLASGKCGLYDAYTLATAITRNYDDYLQTGLSATVNYQHVIDASGAVVLDDDSIARSDGTRPPSFEGSYLTVPPAGREDRTHRLAVKMRRTDIDNGPDSEIGDPQRVDVTVTPRVLLL